MLHVLRIVLTVVLAIVCLALSVVILMQEGKAANLGTIAGIADSYWGKNKGRSMEGKLVTWTKVLGAIFFVLALILNIKKFV